MVQIILLCTLLVFILSVYVIAKRNGYGYLPIFVACYFIFILIIPAFFHVNQNIFPFYSMAYDLNHQLKASIVLLVFSLFFWFGFFVKPTSNKNRIESGFLEIKKINNYRFFLTQFFCFLVILIGILTFGVDSFVVKRGEFDRSVFGEESPIRELFLSGIKSLSFASLFYLIIYKKKLNKILFLFGLFTSIALFMIVNYPLSLPRFILFSYLIAFFCYYFKPNLKNKLTVVLAFFLGITTLFPYISYLTRGNEDNGFEFDIYKYYQSSGDFDGFQSIINTVIYVEKYGYTLGQQILSSILSFVPRSIWISKGEPTGSIAAAAAGYDFLNISSPLPAEFYIDFGFLGLIVFSFVFGWFIRFVDQKINIENTGRLSYILSIILISLIVIISRGPILGVLNNAYIEILIFSILYWLFFLKIKFR